MVVDWRNSQKSATICQEFIMAMMNRS